MSFRVQNTRCYDGEGTLVIEADQPISVPVPTDLNHYYKSVTMKNILNYHEILQSINVVMLVLDNCDVVDVDEIYMHELILKNNNTRYEFSTYPNTTRLDSVSFMNSSVCPVDLPLIAAENAAEYVWQNCAEFQFNCPADYGITFINGMIEIISSHDDY